MEETKKKSRIPETPTDLFSRPLSTKELADYLTVHIETVKKMTRAGTIPSMALGAHTIRYDLAAVLEALKAVKKAKNGLASHGG